MGKNDKKCGAFVPIRSHNENNDNEAVYFFYLFPVKLHSLRTQIGNVGSRFIGLSIERVEMAINIRAQQQ